MHKTRKAAFFDVDRTLIKRASERIFIRYLLKKGILRPGELLYTIPEALRLGKSYRGLLKTNKLYLRGKDVEEIREIAEQCFKEEILSYLSNSAFNLINFHKERHDLIVLLTGSLEFLIEPLRRYLGADRFIATRVGKSDGVFTGLIDGLHPYGTNKLALMRKLAEREGIILEESYAYGDHFSDKEMLEAIGYPVAVNPDLLLWLLARKRNWKIIYIF